jgi:hypothetical protein
LYWFKKSFFKRILLECETESDFYLYIRFWLSSQSWTLRIDYDGLSHRALLHALLSSSSYIQLCYSDSETVHYTREPVQ